jgi:hypothetical protein
MSALGELWRRRRRRPVFFAVSVLVLGGLVVYPAVDWYLQGLRESTAGFGWVPEFHFNDFGTYASATTRWFEGETVYWQREGGGYFATYLYPPVYLLAFYPFLELATRIPFEAVPLAGSPAEVAALLWGLSTVGLLWVGLQLVARELGVSLAWYDRVVGLWALVGFQPLLFSVKLGQVSAFVAATFCFAFVAMERGDRDGSALLSVASGALVALGAGIKLYYATAGAYLLRERERFLGAVAGGVGLLALSVVLFGVDDHLAYLDVLAWGKGWGTDPYPTYLWYPGYYEPTYVLSDWVPAATVLFKFGLVAGVAVLAFLTRDSGADRAAFGLGVAVYPLVAPVAYTQDFVALLVAAAVLVAVEFDRDGRPYLPVAAVGLLHLHAYGWRLIVFDLSGGPPFVGLRGMVVPFLQPGLWGNVLLLGLAAHATLAATDAAERIPAVTPRSVGS